MVANPAQWAWSQLKADGSVDFALGRLQRNFPRVRAGDLVVGYESRPTQRIAALARVTTEYDPDGPPASALTLEPVATVANGLTWTELHADPILANSEPMRFRCQGTLFALDAVESRPPARAPHANATLGLPSTPNRPCQRLTRITFHPSYTYEDFIEGFRPQASTSGALELVSATASSKKSAPLQPQTLARTTSC